jgi:flavin reductase (DIM6/NTAB) family NADH-FMN oxidoreductase RutF
MQDVVAEGFRNAMRNYPQGVTIVACMSEGKPYGMTVSSFISVSMEPPLLLVSVMKGDYIHRLFSHTEYFSVNMLAYDQSELSIRFSQKENYEKRFDGVKYYMDARGVPIIDDCIASIVCKRWKNYDIADHTLIIGRVVEVNTPRDAYPLVYFRKKYTTVRDC